METRTGKQSPSKGENGAGAKDKIVAFTRVEIVRTPVEIVQRRGSPPLLMNKMTEETVRILGAKATGETVPAAEKKSAEATAEGHLHRVGDRFAFPASAWEAAIVDACRHQTTNKKLTMARLDGAFSITGEAEDYCLIESDPYVVRADVVNTSGKNGSPSVSFRPAFPNWKTKLFIDYNPNSVIISELMHLLDLAGFHVGVGSWRPKFGKFTIS